MAVPSVPQSVSLVNPTTEGFTAQWQPPSSANPPVQRYRVQLNVVADEDGASEASQVAQPGTNLRTFTGRDPARRYYFRVRAENADGNGPWSAWASIGTFPVAPANVRVTSPTNGQILVRWDAGDNRNDVVQYQVELNGTIYSGISPGARERLFTGLPDYTNYDARVRAFSTAGSGAWTPLVRGTTLPARPAAPTFSDIGVTQFGAAWVVPNTGSLGSYGTEYQVTTDPSNPGAATLLTGNNPSGYVGVLLTGRAAGQKHYVRARGGPSDLFMSDWGPWGEVSTLPVAPSTPTYPAATATSVTAEWTRGGNGNAIVEYQIQYNYSASDSGATTVSNGTALSRELTGRQPARATYSRVRARTAAGWGAWSAWSSTSTLPAVPGSPAFSSATYSSLVLSYTAGSSYSPGIVEYQIQHNSAATDAGATTVSNGTALSRTLTNLPANATRYARVRARSARGWGDWTAWVSASTLPTPAPGISVSPNTAGTQATVSLSPPAGVTTVTKYRVEYRRVGSGAATSFDTVSTSAVRTGLNPGTSYQWRASAFIGEYQSPWSAWLTIPQPSPTWLPGDFLAGSLPAALDVTYAWTGTANASTSTVTGKGVTGWTVGQATGGGTAVMHQITGGRAGTYGARAIVTRDKTGAGMVLGMNAAEYASVSEGGVYAGSIHVRPSRAQRLVVEMLFFDAAGVEVTPRATGSAMDVTDTAGWTRLVVLGQAPLGAVRGIARARDAEGGVFSPWLAGEWLDADAAMITIGSLYPYWDGNTPNTAEYAYAWTGVANASESSRTTLAQNAVDPLQDPDCPPFPTPPAPPPIEAECIDVVGDWRRYWSILPASEISRWLAIIPTFTLTTTAAVGQVRIRVYENPDNLDPLDLNVNDYVSEQLVTFIPADTVLVVDGVSERTRASVAGGAWRDADHLLQGTDGGPATWPEFSCGQGYVISYDVPLDQPDGNMTPSVQLTGRF